MACHYATVKSQVTHALVRICQLGGPGRPPVPEERTDCPSLMQQLITVACDTSTCTDMPGWIRNLLALMPPGGP